MFVYPDIDPVIASLGPVKVRWYGMMYLVGFLVAWGLAHYRAKKYQLPWSNEAISDLIFYGALGAVIGGRIGYTFFYNFSDFIKAPWHIFYIWQGGMSFHGGFLGVLVALCLFARKEKKPFWQVMDFTAPIVPIGLGAGRMGNFINGELWGRVTDVPWAFIFPHVDGYPRHPSQLYEMFGEGIVLFLVVWFYASKPRPMMAVSGVFALCYGLIRFIVEFFREPDFHLGYIAFGWLSMGQLLSLPMVILGLILMKKAYKNQQPIDKSDKTSKA